MRKIYLMFFLAATVSVANAQVSVTFRVDMDTNTIDAAGVHIAGDFQSEAGVPTDWDPAATGVPNLSGSIHGVTVMIPSGTWNFNYLNGNAWGKDEAVTDTACGGKGGNGAERFVVVPAVGGFTTPAWKFGSCDTAGTVGISEVSNIELTTVYPNPSQGQVTVQFGLKNAVDNLRVEIYDAIGRKISTLIDESAAQGRYMLFWDGSQAQTGVYFVVVKSDNSASTARLMITRD